MTSCDSHVSHPPSCALTVVGGGHERAPAARRRADSGGRVPRGGPPAREGLAPGQRALRSWRRLSTCSTWRVWSGGGSGFGVEEVGALEGGEVRGLRPAC
eukprot:1894465-Rhodomonas_salina.1